MNEKLYQKPSFEERLKLGKSLKDRAIIRMNELESTYGIIAFYMFKEDYLVEFESEQERKKLEEFFSNYQMSQEALIEAKEKFDMDAKKLREIIIQLENFAQNEEDNYWCTSALSTLSEKQARIEEAFEDLKLEREGERI